LYSDLAFQASTRSESYTNSKTDGEEAISCTLVI